MEEIEETKEEQKPEKKELKAKTVSLIGKIVGGSIILIGFILKCLHILDCEIDELIKIGFSEMAVFGTIDINIALDKFLKRE